MAKKRVKRAKVSRKKAMPTQTTTCCKNKYGIIVAVGAVLGVGIGLAYNVPGTGVLIGLGIGLLISGILKLVSK